MRLSHTSRIWTWVLLLLPVPLVLWSGYLILSVAGEQREIRRDANFLRRCAELEQSIRLLENSVLPTSDVLPAPAEGGRWATLYGDCREKLRALPNELLTEFELGYSVWRVGEEVKRLRDIVREAQETSPPGDRRVELIRRARRTGNIAIGAVDGMVETALERKQALSREMGVHWRSLNLIVLVSCVMAILVVVLLHSYRLSTAALKRAEDERNRFFSLSADLLCIAGFDGRFKQVNPAWTKVLGYAMKELIGRPMIELVHPDDEAATREEERRLRLNAATPNFENRYRTPSGGFRWLVWNATADVKRKVIYASARDVTEQKRAEERLTEAQNYARNLVNSSLDMIIAVDPERRIVAFNKAAENVFGYAASEVIGRNVDMLYADPTSGSPVHDRIQERGAFTGEVLNRRKDGDTFPAMLSSSILRDAKGNYLGVMGVSRDITELKRAQTELEEFAARLARSNRELQDFASVASHDLQEPLRKVMTFSDRLAAKMSAQLDEQGRDYLSRMQNATQRMQTLIRDLLTLSRVTTMGRAFVPAELNRIAQEVVSDLEVRIEQLGADVEVADLPRIDADPLQLRQVFQNLIGNALKFHRPGERPVVRVYAELVDADGTVVPGEARGADAACRLIVQDNGIGFDEKHLDRIFEVFQRLHGRDAYEGTGVGLAVCRKIAERHGGSITARSRPGEGSTFVVTLPVRQDHEHGERSPVSRSGSESRSQ